MHVKMYRKRREKMSNLYLHIGTPKTGTSAIQNFLTDNRRLLEKKGYCYPDMQVSFQGIGAKRNGHFLVYHYKSLEKAEAVKKENELVEQKLKMIYELSEKYENIVLSDEGIWNAYHTKNDFWKNLNNALKNHNITLKVIVYLRRQDLFIQSYWAQQVKEIQTYTFSNYINEGIYKACQLNYYDAVKEISDNTGKENMIVRVYESQQFYGGNGNINEDFLDAIGLKMDGEYSASSKIKNTSLYGVYLEAKRVMNYNKAFREKQSYVVDYLRELQEEAGREDAGEETSKLSYFTGDTQRKFMAGYIPGNQKIAVEFLGRKEKRLFYEENIQQTAEKEITYSTEDVVKVISQIVNKQHEQINRLESGVLGKAQKVKVKDGSILKGVIRKLKGN